MPQDYSLANYANGEVKIPSISLETMEAYLLKNPIPVKPKLYLATFTKKPDLSLDIWLKELEKSLSYSFIESFEIAAEHLKSNIHVHAYMRVKEYITKRKFSKFTSHLDLRKVVTDNGVSDYISKESPIFKTYRDLKKYILDNV